MNHKGRNRHFTDVEELEQERKKEQERKWRKKKDGEESAESSSSEEEEKSAGSGSEEDESESDDDGKAKGVQGLIEIENPNRVQKKAAQKVAQVDVASSSAKTELSRREREEVEKQRAQANYQKLHAQVRNSHFCI